MDLNPISAAQAAESGASQADPLTSLLPLILIFVIFYFLLIRPQAKRQKEHQKMVQELQSGEEIVTNGGVAGQITALGEQFVTVRISEGVEVKVQRHAIAAVLPKGTLKGA